MDESKAGKEQKRKKGAVTVQACNGALRLYWRSPVPGEGKKYLYLGLADNEPANWKVAEIQARQIQLDILSQNYDPTLRKYRPDAPKEISIVALFQQFFNFKKQTLSISTLPKYEALIKQLESFFQNKTVLNLTEEHTNKFRKYLDSQNSARTVQERVGLLKACWQWALKKGLIEGRNPWEDIKIKTGVRKKINPFTLDEMKAIIQAFRQHPVYSYYGDYVEFLFGSGLRTGEAIGLRWGALNEDCSVAWIGERLSRSRRCPPKNDKSRYLALSKRLQEILQSRRPANAQPDDLVFTGPKGKPIDDSRFRKRAWIPILESLGIPYRSPYNTRATLASHALESGMSPASVSELTGHEVATLYKHYVGVVGRPKLPELTAFSDVEIPE